MAKKVPKKKTSAAVASDELAIIAGQQSLPIAGEQIVVHEITTHEMLSYRHLLNPLVEGLRSVQAEMSTPGSLDALLDVLAAHKDETEQLVSIACGKPVEWVQGLPSAEGEAVLMAWWVVNAGFFIRQVMRPIIQARMLQAGQTSLPPSSPTATPQTDSSITPVAN